MASANNSLRPSGSDGSDFKHRERIADRYKITVKTKNNMNRLFYLQTILCIVNWVRFCAQKLNYSIDALPWHPLELTSLCTIVNVIIGKNAVNRSLRSSLSLYIFLCNLLELIPKILLIVQLFKDNEYPSYPILLFYSIQLIVTILLLDCAWRLRKIW